MKKKCFVFFILLFVLFTSKIFAQNEPDKKWNVAIGYTTFDKQVLEIWDNQHLTTYHPQIFIKSGYKLSVFWELGLGFGYAHRLRIKDEEKAYNYNSTGYAGWVFSKYHLLPHFIQDDNFPLDIYLSGKAGRYLDKDKDENYTNWHYGAYAGASLYIFGNLGIYGEIGYGNKSIFEAGLNWRF
ncbi:MAG: hypothetical protein K9G70_11835 [Prolixibacteraceae bacterium]|nr:hypothetical protein [Prolixibacteraceae bacterium]